MTDNHKGLPAESVITAMAETWAEMTGIAEKLKSLPSNLPTKEMQERHDELVLRHVKLSYEEGVASGWQAARDHYAPKLTFMKAVKIAAKGIGVGGATGYAVKAISALEAAGIKFQHEVYD